MYIYQITNKITNDSYIGKTIQKLNSRFRAHKYNAFKNDSQTHLHRAMRKYGIEHFLIESIDTAITELELTKKEVKYIEKLKPYYNMTKGGDGGDTSKSPNFILAMEKYHSQKAKSSYATRGMLGKKQSAVNLAAIKKSNCCPVMCEGRQFDSVGEAQDYFKGISVRKRLNSDKYPNFFRLRPKTKRK